MILSDTAIFEALNDGRLVIEPEPFPRLPTIEHPSRPYDRSAVDLTLGSLLRVPKLGMAVAIDFQSGDVAQTLDAHFASETIPATGYPLDRNTFVLGITRERIRLTLGSDLPEGVAGKGCLAARVEGKSSRSRFGLLVHFTAPTIHAGFEGHITLEMLNLGPSPILLRPGMAICQLIVERVEGLPQGEPSQFQGQTDATGQR